MERPPPSPSTSPVPYSVPATGIEISDGLSPPAVWDWGNFLDFAMEADNGLIMQWDSPDIPNLPSPRPPLSKVASSPDPEPVILSAAGSSNHVRKRDPRLVCENYLAGRVPCACPEVDEKEFEVDEEEQQLGGRKRARAGVVNVRLRCQVRGCEEDISELKGYHRRHRVCLRCANALSVIHDGEEKRYCQQCGKFHVLLDFDDDKHSCRRKLERHNRRRRKKTTNSDRAEKENLLQGEPTEGVFIDTNQIEVSEETPKESGWQAAENGARDKISDGDSFLHSECGNGYPSFSSSGLVQAQTKSLSFTASVDTHIVDRIDNQKLGISPTICDNRTFYSSVSPTGRISFKLYDWNPAEFPRRLRHQIFQWLASMPVELEGYIRPGCTILTIFIAMPHNIWEKLHQDGDLFIKQLVNSSESLFWGRGNILIYLSDMVVHVLKDGTSFIKMEVEAPRLHYVHPMYFEAGKGLEFIVCGSNLDRPKLRFLVSFAGKYLLCDNYRVISHQDVWCDGKSSVVSSNSHGHEMFRIKIKQTQSESFGPAFIEVENESGISNFIPILIGDKEICSELENLGGTFCYRSSGAEDKCGSNAAFTNTIFSKVTVARHIDMTDLLLDIAWMLKKPCQDCYESFFDSLNVQRINNLLQFSLQNELTSVLKAVLKYAAIVFHEAGFQNFKNWTVGADLVQLLQNMETARKFINQRTLQMGSTMLVSGHSSYLEAFPAIYVENELFIMNHTNQVEGSCLPALASPPLPSVNSDEGVSHVSEDVSCSEISFRRFSSSYWPTNMPSSPVSRRWHAVFVLCTCVICFLLCIILLNPQKASDFVIYMVALREKLVADSLCRVSVNRRSLVNTHV